MNDNNIRQRKLRVLIITMGGARQEILQDLFESSPLCESFEPPTFCPGIPSRSLRNRENFFLHCYTAGLLPEAEWEALQERFVSTAYREQPERLFECLKDVPVPTEGRRGSDVDVSLHYSVEIWRKAKTLNRGRAVLGCALAHLTALRRLVFEDYDLLLEDNVRFPVAQVAQRIRETVCSLSEWEIKTGNKCHIRYFGWLGSLTNLDWIDSSHRPRTTFVRESFKNGVDSEPLIMSCFPMPTLQDIEADLASSQIKNGSQQNDSTASPQMLSSIRVDTTEQEPDDATAANNDNTVNEDRHQVPGGNPVWGTYAYWISKDAYKMVLDVLRRDVGALMWKSKRMRYYHVKPIDKILPRQIRAHFGAASVQLATHPTFFRAPMLTSKIHSQWDPEFCKSTTLQLQQSGLAWCDLALTPQEREVVTHYETTGEWQTPAQLRLL